MYRYVEGTHFSLAEYYRAEDAHHYHQDVGIRFQSHLYRRHSPSTWLWRIVFTYTIFSRRRFIEITWEVRAAPDIDSWLLRWSS
jgi:hypothetical protein